MNKAMIRVAASRPQALAMGSLESGKAIAKLRLTLRYKETQFFRSVTVCVLSKLQ